MSTEPLLESSAPPQNHDQGTYQLNESRVIDEALIRRVEAAVSSAVVSRSAVEFDWPECHKTRCQSRHGNVDSAFSTMKTEVMRAIRSELAYEMTTRPDITEPSDTPEQAAVYTLATLLRRYNVRDAGTFVNAAQLLVDAYPALIPALGETAALEEMKTRITETMEA